ncbi:MAG: YifB family Mg chelatase-like AAA ATPase [Planctomycetota bacterium]
MLSRVQSFILQGIDATVCEIEIDLDDRGLNEARLVGLPDAAVKESLDRVRSAAGNTGYPFPPGKLTINLAPADVRKEGPVYDLPIAIGVLVAAGVIVPNRVEEPAPIGAGAGWTEDGPEEELDAPIEPLDPRRFLFAGELALDGRIRPIRGALAMAALAKELGLRGVVVPQANAREAAIVEGIEAIGVGTLAEAVGLLTGGIPIEPHQPVDLERMIGTLSAEIDFAEVRGQEAVKRAITVAAAGEHNLIMLGPPGTGKSMMAKALPGILPPMSAREAIAATRIYSSAGKPGINGGSHDEDAHLVVRRPVRAPHHTASPASIIGGGVVPKPGEISLAHHGVLFLDELPEFPRSVLETLRQPLEDGAVTISRAHGTVRFPAEFMLIAAMNPTQRGTLPDGTNGRREMGRYLSKLSAPLIDRIDIHVEVPAVPWKELSGKPTGTSTDQMRERVLGARERQLVRQGDRSNARLSGKQLDGVAQLDETAMALLGQAIAELGLSARAYDKIRRVARTVADLDGKEVIDAGHVAEAVQYRLLDRQM